MFRFSAHVSLLFLVLLAGTVACTAGNASAVAVPGPVTDAPKAAKPGEQTAVIAGGCFWGIQAVFQHVKGVISATSGYSGGEARTAEELLRVFFSVAHDPTQLNRQGPDDGTQYRSVIFYGNDEQKKIAERYIAQLDQAKVFPRPIVTQVVRLKAFYPAEAYHQDYATRHPNQPYIVYNDAPKVAHLQQQFPELYTGK